MQLEMNQQNQPRKNKVDSKGNREVRVFVKSGTATLRLAEKLTENAAKVLCDSIKNNIERLGGTLSCEFMITQ